MQSKAEPIRFNAFECDTNENKLTESELQEGDPVCVALPGSITNEHYLQYTYQMDTTAIIIAKAIRNLIRFPLRFQHLACIKCCNSMRETWITIHIMALHGWFVNTEFRILLD